MHRAGKEVSIPMKKALALMVIALLTVLLVSPPLFAQDAEECPCGVDEYGDCIPCDVDE